jgi:cytochrome b6-f complex iron-sulfur subunit
MAEITTTAAKPTPAAKPSETKPQAHGAGSKGALGMTAAEAAELRAPVTRREFLNYAFLASLGFLFVGTGVATYLFAFPRFKAGEFGGKFDLGTAKDTFPAVTDPPKPDSKARIWLSNTPQGVLALYNVCVHLGCLYQWQPSTNRFECPCHGSKYQKNGTYIEGPAPRSLDRMVVSFTDASGKVLAQTDPAGDPIPIPDPNALVIVDTGKIILGKSHG